MNGATTGPGRRTVLATLALLIGGCATTSTVEQPAGYVPGPAYHLLMAEIAAQRGVPATAAEEYVYAAEQSDDPAVSRRATEFAFGYGFDDQALRAARRWAQLAPDSQSAQLFIARLLVRRNDVGGATAAAERALGDAAGRAAEDYALLYAELGQEENAAVVTRVLARLAARAPQAPTLDLALGRSALRSGELDLALWSARSALATAADPDVAADAAVLIGRVLLARGDGEGALAQAKSLPGAETSLDAGLEHARLLAALGRHPEALREIDDLVERHGDEPELRRLRALVHLDAGDPRAAWQDFTSLIGVGDLTDEGLYYLAEIAAREGRAEQAGEIYERVPEGPYLLPARSALATIAEARDGADAALRILEAFAAENPRFVYETSRLRAGILQRAGREAEARALLDELVLARPRDAELRLARGALLEQLGESEAALGDMRAALAAAPDDPAALNALGYTLANRSRDHDEAYRLIRRAIEQEPASAAILDSYGWVLYRQGALPEARSYLQLAFSLFPDPEVAAHLGEVMWLQGEQDAARRVWQEALDRAPDSAPLRETMQRFVGQTGTDDR